MALLHQRSKPAHKKQSRTADIVRWVEDGIASGRLTAGAKIDEHMLAEMFQVSKTPVREALIHLSALGLVEMRQRRGATVSSLSVEQVIATFEFMAELESMAARLASTRMSRDEHAQLMAAYRSSKKLLDDEAMYNLADAGLHEIISRGSCNPYLDEAIRGAHGRTRLYRTFPFHHPGLSRQSYREHAVIFAAIISGDAETAARGMRDHITTSGRIFADLVARLTKVR